MSYIYQGEPEQRILGALPDGDYLYVVADCNEPYQKDSGNWVLSVKLSIQPSGMTVFANPWTGVDRNGEQRDGIADFLLSCNRAPQKGKEPDWRKVAGAKGKCRLKTEIAAQGALTGKEVNKIHYFYRPKQVGPAAEGPLKRHSQEEYNQLRKEAEKKAGSLDVEPDDIPF